MIIPDGVAINSCDKKNLETLLQVCTAALLKLDMAKACMFVLMCAAAALQSGAAFSHVMQPLLKLVTLAGPNGWSSKGEPPRLRQERVKKKWLGASIAPDKVQDFETLRESLWNPEIQKDWESFYKTVESEDSYFAFDVDGVIPEDLSATIFRNGYTHARLNTCFNTHTQTQSERASERERERERARASERERERERETLF